MSRGMTLLELMLALVIIAITSTAACTLIIGTMNANRFVQAQNAALCEMDGALRRIVYNLRTADAAPTWGLVGGVRKLQIARNGTGTIAYYVDTNNNLVETDARYNGGAASTLIHGMSNSGFTCTITGPSASQLNTEVAVNISAATLPPIERHLTVAIRGY